MKKELIVGFILTIFLVIAGLFFIQNYKLQQAKFALYSLQNNSTQQNVAGNNSNQINPTDVAKTLNVQDVATHNSANDCWIIISGRVYNATGYLNLHPGGSNRIIPYCGQDATQAFITQGGGGSHSSLAYNDLAQLYIGDLGTQAPAANLQTNPTPTPAPTTANSNNEEEFEDD